jgi:hypothetical protein
MERGASHGHLAVHGRDLVRERLEMLPGALDYQLRRQILLAAAATVGGAELARGHAHDIAQPRRACYVLADPPLFSDSPLIS